MLSLKKLCIVLIVSVFAFSLAIPGVAGAVDKMTIAYFPGWPSCFAVGWEKGWFEEEMGVEVDFRGFDSGAQISTAMASGRIAIGQDVGTSPFIAAVSQGVPIKMVAIGEDNGPSENIIAQKDSGIVSPKDLMGKVIGLPVGTSSHYRTLTILKEFGIDRNKVDIIDMAPQDVLAAFKRGDIDAGCSWDPVRTKMLEEGGHPIISAETQSLWGIRTGGNIVANIKFSKKNPELITKYLEVVNRSIKFYKENPEEAARIIGNKVGVEQDKCRAILDTLIFFTAEEQLQPNLLGTEKNPGMFLDSMKDIADFLEAQGNIDKALASYDSYVDTQYLENFVK